MAQKERALRVKRAVEEVDEDDACKQPEEELSLREQLQATKLLQQQRARRKGTDTVRLAVSAPDTIVEVAAHDVEGDLMDSFSKEQLRSDADVDVHMHKFVEEQLSKRLGRPRIAAAVDVAAKNPEEELYDVPAELQETETGATDPVGAWTTSIAEVALPLDYKLANIEETEAAKKRLLDASASDSDDGDGAGSEQGVLQRGSFPHGFGRSSFKEVNIREIAILKSKDHAFRRKRLKAELS